MANTNIMYAHRKFGSAMNFLNTAGSLKQRIFDAYWHCLRDLSANDLPEELSDEFNLFINLMKNDNSGGYDSTIINIMSDEDIEILYRKIISMHDKVLKEFVKAYPDYKKL